jgi:hypothetical protein
LLAPVVVMAMGMGPHDPRREVGKMLGKTAISAGIFFALVAILVFPWFLIAWRTWGTPFYNAGEAGITSVHSWFAFLNGRPWYTYLVSIPVMVPLYLLGFYRIITVWRSGARFGDVILAIWFLVFLVVVTVVAALSEQLGPDARYMLPAYPPLAILTAAQIGRLMDGQKGKVPGAVLRWGLVAALLMTCAWSFWLTEPSRMEFPRIYDNFMNVPF